MTSGSYEASPNAVASALQWLQGALLGTVATTVGVIAVASVGFLMLQGRIDMRRAAQVVFGCFIVFGASAASETLESLRSGGIAAPPELALPPSPPAVTTPAAPPTAYDPYAGAALPPPL